MNQTHTEVTKTAEMTETTVQETSAPKNAEETSRPHSNHEGDYPRGHKTVITERAQAKRTREKLVYGFLALCGLVMLAAAYHSFFGSTPRSETTQIMGVQSVSQSSQRNVKLVDVSKCRRDQLKIVAGDTLVSDSDCTVITYDDGK